MTGIVQNPQVPLCYRFTYDGVIRHVDNVTIDGEQQQLLGMEIRKAGKFSFRIKRYSLIKIDGLQKIDPVERVGKVARP